MNRNIFYTHRSFNNFLDSYLKGEKVYLYTGRGPSSIQMHLGHLIPFLFTSFLQKVFNCPLIIQIADEEKSVIKNKNLQEIHNNGIENIKEIISLGFIPEKTFIFFNREYRLKNRNFELLVSQMKSHVSIKELKKIFGFCDETLMGVYDWPFYQACASFSDGFIELLYSDKEIEKNIREKLLEMEKSKMDNQVKLLNKNNKKGKKENYKSDEIIKSNYINNIYKINNMTFEELKGEYNSKCFVSPLEIKNIDLKIKEKKDAKEDKKNKKEIKDSFKVLIPHAIDQDPYFRLSRDVSPILNQPKASSIMCKFLPPLSGVTGKMSSTSNNNNNNSIQNDSIFLSDDNKTLKKKVSNSFSGSRGDGSLMDHRKYGGNADIDVSCNYLKFFEDDCEKYEKYISEFNKGKITSSEIKEVLFNKLKLIIEEINESKMKVGDEDIRNFMNFNKKIL